MHKILIVDDEVGIIEEVKSFFEEEGYEVRAADTAKDGMKELIDFEPEVLILDMKLPDMSGLNVLKFSKQNYPQTKVIVNTGYVDQQIIDDSERLGRDAFLQKPFDLARLRDEVEKMLGLI